MSTTDVSTTDVSATKKQEKRKANPVPYIIVFAILFLIVLGLLTWVLDVYNKQHQCILNPNVWCSDNWTCTASCDNTSGVCMQVANANITNPGPVSDCFCTDGTGTTGLASCLYGPDAPGATNCLNPGVGGETGVGTCTCPTGTEMTQVNCLQSCVQDLQSLLQSPNPPVCCCNPDNFDDPAMKTYCRNNQAACS